ncbi:MAG: hypothetical protein PHS86_11140, partial [Syntrophaceae bacterium]|nr:hypothetical protein [Syntrophaceae bacterium]
MNLTEFMEKNDIKCTENIDFNHSQEFYAIKQFEQKCYRIDNIPCLIPETYEVRTFDIRLRGEVREKFDKLQNKMKRQFFVNRSFRYPGIYDDFSTVEDAVEAGKTLEDATSFLQGEIERFLFFRRYDLIDDGRYW